MYAFPQTSSYAFFKVLRLPISILLNMSLALSAGGCWGGSDVTVAGDSTPSSSSSSSSAILPKSSLGESLEPEGKKIRLVYREGRLSDLQPMGQRCGVRGWTEVAGIDDSEFRLLCIGPDTDRNIKKLLTKQRSAVSRLLSWLSDRLTD